MIKTINMKKLRPLTDRVIVEPFESEKQTKGGLYIPDTAQGQEPLIHATVISVGKSVENIKEKEVVAYPNGAGIPVNVDELKYHILREQDLIMVIENE